MVDRYKAQPGEIRNESHFTLPGNVEYVLASDYAALEAERDELKRKIDEIVALIKSKVPAEKQLTETHFQYINRQRYHNAQIQMGSRILAIMEGL